MVIALLRWWYTTGWIYVLHRIGASISHIDQSLSVSILLKTLFAPWRRIITFGGKSIDQKVRAAFDNVVSRCIGCTIRLSVLLFAGISILLCLIVGMVITVIWPLLPLAALFFLGRSIFG